MLLSLKKMLPGIFFRLFIKDGYSAHLIASYRSLHKKHIISEWLHSTVIQKRRTNLLKMQEQIATTLVKNIKFKAFDRILDKF